MLNCSGFTAAWDPGRGSGVKLQSAHHHWIPTMSFYKADALEVFFTYLHYTNVHLLTLLAAAQPAVSQH